MRLSSRRGVTLVELLIGITLAAILGMSLTRLLIGQTRFNERVEAGQRARSVSRSALNAMYSELRMVDANDGVTFARDSAVQMRVPYAVGIVCNVSAGQVIGAFLPVDSAMFAAPGYAGFAVRDPLDGQYVYHVANTAAPATNSTSACTGAPANVTLMTGARVLRVNTAATVTAVLGTPVLLYRNVRYAFNASAAIPGRRALWRRQLDAAGATVTASEELAAPFDSTARFRFFILNSRTPSDTLPTALADLRGLSVFLPGESEGSPRLRGAPEQANLSSSVFFLNRAD